MVDEKTQSHAFALAQSLVLTVVRQPWSRAPWSVVGVIAVVGMVLGIVGKEPEKVLEGGLPAGFVALVVATWFLMEKISKGSGDLAEAKAAALLFDFVAACVSALTFAYLVSDYAWEKFVTADEDSGAMIGVVVVIIVFGALLFTASSGLRRESGLSQVGASETGDPDSSDASGQ